jgi:PST family polysaccharide transporter
MQLTGGIVLTGVAAASAGAFTWLYRTFVDPTEASLAGQLTPLIRWLSLGFLVGALGGTQGAILQRRFAFKALAVRRLAASVAGGAVGIAMAARGWGVWSLVGQSLISSVVGVIVLWRASEWRPGWNVSRRCIADLWSFGVNVTGIEVLNFVNRRSDDLLIGCFLGPVALGYYTLAYGLLLQMTQILTQTVSSVSLSTFSRLQGKPDQMRHAFLTATRLTSFVAFPAFLGLAAVAGELVPVVFGSRWLPSVPVVQVLAFIGVLHSVEYFTPGVIMAAGRPSWVLGVAVLNAVTNLAAFITAVRWGIVAVAVAYVIRGWVFSPIPPYLVGRLIGLPWRRYLGQLAAPLIGCSVMVAAVLGVKQVLPARIGLRGVLAVDILLGVAVYGLTILWIAPGLYREALELIRLAVAGGPSKDERRS